jgi:8-oxo-dGTP diphosphatase
MQWKPQTPFLSVDGIVEIYTKDEKFLGIVLISRKNPPHGKAIPGGFVDIGESVENAVIREMKEEISLNVTIQSLLGIYSHPKRDKRFHTVSIVYICKAYGVPEGADDAKEAKIYNIKDLKKETLVFDHTKIISDYLNSDYFNH